MSKTNNAGIGIENNRFRERPNAKLILELVARRGIRGEGINLPLGGRKFGRKEEKMKAIKKGRKEERKI